MLKILHKLQKERPRGQSPWGNSSPAVKSLFTTLLFKDKPAPSCTVTFMSSLAPSSCTTSLTLLASSQSGVYGTLRTVSAGRYQATFLRSFFFCLALGCHSLGLYRGTSPDRLDVTCLSDKRWEHCTYVQGECCSLGGLCAPIIEHLHRTLHLFITQT